MADLASSDVTITVQKQRVEGKTRRNLVKIAFGNGTLTYPSGGVPLPAKSYFGMKHSLDHIVISDGDDAQGILWKYDYENKKLRGYIQGFDNVAAGAATVDDFALDTTDEPMSSAISLGLSSTAGAGVKYLGRMREMLAATHAPAATVIYAEAVGS